MRLRCFKCGKSVSTEVPDETIIRATLECPECLEITLKKIIEEETQRLREKLAIAVEAMKDSVARADDCGDSYNSHPVREALAKIRGEKLT